MAKELHETTLQNHLLKVQKEKGITVPKYRWERSHFVSPELLAATKDHLKAVGKALQQGKVVSSKVLESGATYNTPAGIGREDWQRLERAYRGLVNKVKDQAVVTSKPTVGSWRSAVDHKELETRPSLLYGCFKEDVVCTGYLIILGKKVAEEMYGSYLKRKYNKAELEHLLSQEYKVPTGVHPDDSGQSLWPKASELKRVKVLGQSRDGEQVFLSDGNFITALNSDYWAAVCRYTSNPTMYARDASSPVLVQENGKPAALVMPIFRQGFPQVIVEAAAKLKGDAEIEGKLEKLVQPIDVMPKGVERPLPKISAPRRARSVRRQRPSTLKGVRSISGLRSVW